MNDFTDVCYSISLADFKERNRTQNRLYLQAA